jgi:hypothetical protein
MPLNNIYLYYLNVNKRRKRMARWKNKNYCKKVREEGGKEIKI